MDTYLSNALFEITEETNKKIRTYIEEYNLIQRDSPYAFSDYSKEIQHQYISLRDIPADKCLFHNRARAKKLKEWFGYNIFYKKDGTLDTNDVPDDESMPDWTRLPVIPYSNGDTCNTQGVYVNGSRSKVVSSLHGLYAMVRIITLAFPRPFILLSHRLAVFGYFDVYHE